jgi:putative ABC transport system ATP-binding protein
MMLMYFDRSLRGMFALSSKNVLLKAELLSKRLVEVGKDSATSSRILFQDVSFEVGSGEILAIEGRSGSGKSTLLNCLVGLSELDTGSVYVNGNAVPLHDDGACSKLRLTTFGLVFQFFNLLPALTLLQNITLPALLLGTKNSTATNAALALCNELGITHCARRLPSMVSGGEAQRAAVARALINNPKIILADEPTGNLDAQNGSALMDLLGQAVEHRDCGVILVSHDADTVMRASRSMKLGSGGLSL